MYRLIRFGSTDLEYRNQVDTIDSGITPTNYFDLPEGGAIDGFGSDDKNPTTVERIKKMTLTGSTEAAVSAAFFGLMALRGKKRQLFRRTTDGDYHWQNARLSKVISLRDYQKTRFCWMQDIELHFICQDATWRGNSRSSWLLDSGVMLDNAYALDTGEAHTLTANPCAITISVGAATDPGRAEVRSMQIVVSAGASGMSNVTIARTGGESLTYTRTIPAGGQLVINTGTEQVSCSGVAAAYNLLDFAPAADMTAWFTLQPGANTITVTYTGGGAGKSIEFIFSEAWY